MLFCFVLFDWIELTSFTFKKTHWEINFTNEVKPAKEHSLLLRYFVYSFLTNSQSHNVFQEEILVAILIWQFPSNSVWTHSVIESGDL